MNSYIVNAKCKTCGEYLYLAHIAKVKHNVLIDECDACTEQNEILLDVRSYMVS